MIKNYLLLAWKVLLRRKFFTFISLFGISFTLMVLMVITALLDNVFDTFPPETRLDRSLGVFEVRLESPDRQSIMFSSAGYKLLDQAVRTLSNIEQTGIFSDNFSFSIYKNGREIKRYLKYTDGGFWRILDFDFLEGRPLTDEDDRSARAVAVINEDTRTMFFDGQSALGKNIAIDGRNFQVVGVVRNVPFFRFTPFSDVWIPTSAMTSPGYREELVGTFAGLILAKDRRDFDQIKSEFKNRVEHIQLPDPKEYNKISSSAETLFEQMARNILGSGGFDDQQDQYSGRFLAIIISIMLLFMLLPAINLVNITISRIMERSSEIGVRKAFGASSRTLIAQFIVENMVLVLVGGGLGLLLSFIVLHYIEEANFFPYAQFHFNYRIFLYMLAMTVFFGLLSGVYPAWRMSKLHPAQVLKGGVQ